jgi:hypothetical protein
MNSTALPQLPVSPDGRFEVFVGFDLGHGETCLVSVQADDDLNPEPLEVDHERAFPTALSRAGDQYEVGRRAINSANVEELEIAFKTRPVPGTAWEDKRPTIVKYARVCYQKVNQYLPDELSGLCFLIGCPTGWSNNDVDEYSKVFVEADLPHPLVLRESWAALIHARDSKLIPPEKLNSSIIVIDIGSSTTDITYINDLQVADVEGGYNLGAGLIDNYVLQENLKRLSDRQWWKEHFAQDRNEERRALFAARQVKEDYFRAGKDEREQGVLVAKRLMKNLILQADREMIDGAIHSYCYEQLAGKTWASAYRELLQEIHSRLDFPPAFILLTGGASRMEFTETICQEVFSGKTKVPLKNEPAPETAVASGLARTGRWLQRCHEFAEEIENTFTVDVLKATLKPEVPKAINAFLLKSLEASFTHIMPTCIDEWKGGKIKAIDGLAKAFKEKGREWEAGDEGRKIKNETAQQLIKVVVNHVAENASKIADKYRIPPQKLHFELDVGSVPYFVEIQKWLENKYYVAFDRTVGKIVDWFQGWGSWIAPLAKGYLWLIGQFEMFFITVIGGLLSATEAEQHTQRLAEAFHAQMLEQFRAQQKAVLPWIR